MKESNTSPMRKRILSLALALVMLLSAFPVTALASEQEDVLDDGIDVINDQTDPVVPEEPEQTDAFRIGSFGWGNNCIDNESRAGRQIYCVVTDKYGISVKTDTVTLNMA